MLATQTTGHRTVDRKGEWLIGATRLGRAATDGFSTKHIVDTWRIADAARTGKAREVARVWRAAHPTAKLMTSEVIAEFRAGVPRDLMGMALAGRVFRSS